VYNDTWLQEQNLRLDNLPESPVRIDHPLEARQEWACMDWNRRTYEQVMGAPFSVVKNHEPVAGIR